MEEYAWNFHLGAKGGQTAKESKKTGAIKLANKEPEFALKIKIKSIDDNVDEVLKEILERTGNLDDVSFTISGTEKKLQGELKTIAKIVADHGGQKTLDMHFDEEKIRN